MESEQDPCKSCDGKMKRETDPAIKKLVWEAVNEEYDNHYVPLMREMIKETILKEGIFPCQKSLLKKSAPTKSYRFYKLTVFWVHTHACISSKEGFSPGKLKT